ncbi:hypothetical protein Tco_1174332 [Tanacetum coccineum]
MEIMDREVKKLKKRRIPVVKVRWNSRRGPEITWEREDEMKRKFKLLFGLRPLKNSLEDGRGLDNLMDTLTSWIQRDYREFRVESRNAGVLSLSYQTLFRIMAGRNTRSSTANNTNPPNETADEERDQREATPLHYQRLGLLVKEFFSTKGAVGYYCESIESELQSLSCPLRSHNVLKPATIQGAVSMANRLTTDGIKDGLFKKTENAGNKRRSNDQNRNRG